jgi:hypothetical protein
MFRLVSSCRNARMDRIIMTMLTQYSLLEPQCNDQDHVLKVSSIPKMGECRMNSQLEQGAKKKNIQLLLFRKLNKAITRSKINGK